MTAQKKNGFLFSEFFLRKTTNKSFFFSHRILSVDLPANPLFKEEEEKWISPSHILKPFFLEKQQTSLLFCFFFSPPS